MYMFDKAVEEDMKNKYISKYSKNKVYFTLKSL